MANYKIRQWLLPYSDGRTFGNMKARTVVIHNTAMDASAQNEAKYVHNGGGGVTYHYAVDDKEAIQLLPHNRSGWHAGDGGKKDGGRYGIAIEICYSKSGGTRYDKSEDNAAHLAAQILKQEGLPISALSKHQDWSGKYCPHRILSKKNGWANFIAKVNSYMATKPQTQDQYILLDGRPFVSESAIVAFIKNKNPNPKLTCSVEEFVRAFYEECKKENVRPDLAIALSIKETGYWKYGGIVLPTQNNFGGLAAFNDNKTGDAASFPNCQIGARAIAQHLRGYATKSKPTQAIVDPRYQALIDNKYLGTVLTYHGLGGKWAYPGYDKSKFSSLSQALQAGESYGQDITRIYDQMMEFAKSHKEPPKEKPVQRKLIGVFAANVGDIGNAMRIVNQVKGTVFIDINRVDPDFYSEIVQVGGGTKHEKATVHIAGANRYETDAEVTKWINAHK